MVKESDARNYSRIHFINHAPTASMSGIYPSRRLLSNLLISSTDVALAMAFLTLSASSFDINRPALPAGAAGLGSSVVTVDFDVFVDTVEAIVVANAVGSFSAVRNIAFAVVRS
jgi:hypothetical protein